MEQNIPLSQIVPAIENNRDFLIASETQELADQIKETGLLHPVSVVKRDDGKYGLFIGFRRFAAHQLLGAESIRCNVFESMAHDDMVIGNIMENIGRVNISIGAEAKGLAKLAELRPVHEIAKKLGKSTRYISNRLDAVLIDMCVDGRLFPLLESKELAFSDVQQLAQVLARAGRERCITVFDSKIASKKTLKQREEERRLLSRKPQPSRKEIMDVLFILLEQLDDGLWSSCLAWSAGNITTMELLERVPEAVEKLEVFTVDDKPYRNPYNNLCR